MSEISRDRTVLLDQNEIEAIKICQEIIKRMAENSAKTKNFFFAISAAFVALIGSSSFQLGRTAIASYLVIAVAMWYMDARYLQLEQMFRGVHSRIVNGCQPNLDNWMFWPEKADAQPILKLMLWNFSTAIYPVVSLALTILCCA